MGEADLGVSEFPLGEGGRWGGWSFALEEEFSFFVFVLLLVVVVVVVEAGEAAEVSGLSRP